MCNLHLSSVCLEIDTKMVVDAVHGSKENTIEFGSIIDTCKYFLNTHGLFQLSFGQRQANQASYNLP